MKLEKKVKREEDALFFEHSQNYKEYAKKLEEIWLDEIYTFNEKGKKTNEKSKDYDDLISTISKDFELLKFYAISGIVLCVAEGKNRKIPEEVLEDIKRRAFLDMTKVKNEKAIKEVTISLSKKLKEAFVRHNTLGYSRNVKNAISFIHNNKFEKLKTSVIANELGLERTYLAKIFKEETNKTVTDYIKDLKMELAQKMIVDDCYELYEISEMLGYTEYSYFSKIFKKFYGITPSDYKERKGGM